MCTVELQTFWLNLAVWFYHLLGPSIAYRALYRLRALYLEYL